MTNCSHVPAPTHLNDTDHAGFCTQWGEPVRGNRRPRDRAACIRDEWAARERIASLP